MNRQKRHTKTSQIYSAKETLILATVFSAILFLIVGSIIPTQSRLLFGLSFFILAGLLIGGGALLFWFSWIKPVNSTLLRKRYRMMKATWGRLSWLWFMPESLLPTYMRLASIFAIVVGLFLLTMVINHFVLGHQAFYLGETFP